MESVDFTYSSRQAWLTINRLTGRGRTAPGKCPVSANAIASQLVKNGRHKHCDQSFQRKLMKKMSEKWKSPSVDADLSSDFTRSELIEAIYRTKSGKTPGPDLIHLEFIPHAGKVAITWLQEFYSICIRRLRIPKIWRRAVVIVIPKLNKPIDNPKSYRPISLLCVPFKILEHTTPVWSLLLTLNYHQSKLASVAAHPLWTK